MENLPTEIQVKIYEYLEFKELLVLDKIKTLSPVANYVYDRRVVAHHKNSLEEIDSIYYKIKPITIHYSAIAGVNSMTVSKKSIRVGPDYDCYEYTYYTTEPKRYNTEISCSFLSVESEGNITELL